MDIQQMPCEKDQRLTNQLLSVVSELIETMADALSKDPEAARECVRHASAEIGRAHV